MAGSRVAWMLALCGAVVTAAPQQRGDAPVLSARTDLVTLAVTVVDRRGELVAGLGPERFTVYDNGEPQPIQLFSSDDLPATIGLVVDCSASMRGRREDVATAVAAFAEMRGSADEFFTLNFNEWVWPGLPPAIAFTDDAGALRAALVCDTPQGMTALYDAVDRGLRHLEQGTRERKALIVVSDGGDNASAETLDAVLQRTRQSSAIIYAVTLYDPDNRDARPQVLRRLTDATGGRTFSAHSSEDVTRAFLRIAREIRAGYTIGFVQSEHAAGYRSLRVAVDSDGDRRLIARTRAGYYAVPGGTSDH